MRADEEEFTTNLVVDLILRELRRAAAERASDNGERKTISPATLI